METHILQMDTPDNPVELATQMKALVKLFYEDAAPMPLILPLRYMTGEHGPLHALCHILSDKWDAPARNVAECMLSSLGVAAKVAEMEWVKDQEAGKDPSKDWLEKNMARISFLALCCQHEKAGLGCACAFCCTVHFGSNFKKNNLEELCQVLRKQHEEERDINRCCQTLTDGLAMQFKWDKPREDWGIEYDR
jgi:hypothetical protein